MAKRLPAASPQTLATRSRLTAVIASAALLIGAPSLVFGQQTAGGETQGFEAYISEDALQALYVRNMDVGELGTNDVRVGFFINEDRDLIGLADMLVDVGEPDRRPYWQLEVGPRVYGALLAVEDQDIFAVAVGGKLSYFLGRSRNTSVSASLFYAPDIITFGSADNVKDVSIRLETQLTDATRIFVGYRNLEFDLALDREVDDGMHVGIHHSF